MLTAGAVHAQDITGTWQGTLNTGPQQLRSILIVAKTDSARLQASFLSIDQGGFDRPIVADSVIVKGSVVRLVFGSVRGSYDGVVSANGTSIKGTWTQTAGPQPLDYTRPTKETAWRDPSPHSSRFFSREKTVKLETLDWGGSGRPVVLLAGAGNSAHIFDQFAPKLTPTYHVYGITRRGFGFSSAPTSGYLADSLADDVLAMIDSLGLTRPVLIGHSIAGEELSSIGSRHPEKVAGLVYLDAGYGYAFYDPTQENTSLTIPDVQRKLARLFDIFIPMSPKDRAALIQELLDTSLPAMERDMRGWSKRLATAPNQTVTPPAGRPDPVARALFAGEQKYTEIHGPVLAIYASPHEAPASATDSAARARADSADLARITPQINAFERGVPSARVVRLPHANHYVFRSNEADVLREIRAFIAGLAPPDGK
jgi:pimeloyl-ACP methyl ester carboxylesterase